MLNMSKFVRLNKTVNSKGTLVPIQEIYKHIKDNTVDHYTSVYNYNDSHYKLFEETGSIAGLKDLKTNKVWFDFDNESNPQEARKDAIELINRLEKYVKTDTLEIYFSGKKGFNVILNLTRELNRKQVETFAKRTAKGLKTFDPVIYDEARLLRVPGTKHQDSGYYKIPLTFEELKTLTGDQIRQRASKPLTPKEACPTSHLNTLDDHLFEVEEPKIELKPSVHLELDLSSKPRQWKSSKWALMQGFFGPGERDTSMMILAATCKAMGYDETTTYYMCKSALKKSWERYGKGHFEKQDLWKKIEQVYSSTWNGGQYSEKTDIYLQKKCEELDIKELVSTSTTDIKGALRIYKDYAKNINKLTLKTGIKELDEKQRITVGMAFGIVASPGSGKCLGKDTPVLMFDGSIKMVQDIIPGDILMGDDSTARNVLSTCTGKEQLYKIKQNNGNDYIVNESHILSLKGGATFSPKARNTKYNYGKLYDIELKDYLNGSKKSKKYFRGYKVPIEFKEQKTNLDPYLFGLWLGDGTSTQPQITVGKRDIELFSYLKLKASEMNLTYGIRQDRQCYRFNFKKFKRTPGKNFFAKNINDNKIIPQEYLINSKENRLQLLAGLIDSDGHYSFKKGYYEITQKNNKLSEQIVYLCRSLGFRTTTNKSEKYCYYKGEKRVGIYNRIIFTAEDLTEIPTKLKRKQSIKINKQRYHDLTKITVEKLEIGDYYGFEIDGNKRFLLGDFTVTHNTTLALTMLHSMSKAGELCVFFSYDMYAPLIVQKIIQKHWNKNDHNIEEVFKRYEAGDQKYVDEVEALIAAEYPNVEFCFETGQSMDDIYETIRAAELKKGMKCKFVVMDYNELVITDISDPTQSSNKVAQSVRALAQKEQLCVLSLFQPSKVSGDPSQEIMSYRAAKGGSGIEQSLRLMLGVSRPGYDANNPSEDKYLNLKVLKNNMGSIFSVDLHWDGYKGEVKSLSNNEKAQLKILRQRKEDEKNGKRMGLNEGWDDNF